MHRLERCLCLMKEKEKDTNRRQWNHFLWDGGAGCTVRHEFKNSWPQLLMEKRNLLQLAHLRVKVWEWEILQFAHLQVRKCEYEKYYNSHICKWEIVRVRKHFCLACMCACVPCPCLQQLPDCTIEASVAFVCVRVCVCLHMGRTLCVHVLHITETVLYTYKHAMPLTCPVFWGLEGEFYLPIRTLPFLYYKHISQGTDHN